MQPLETDGPYYQVGRPSVYFWRFYFDLPNEATTGAEFSIELAFIDKNTHVGDETIKKMLSVEDPSELPQAEFNARIAVVGDKSSYRLQKSERIGSTGSRRASSAQKGLFFPS